MEFFNQTQLAARIFTGGIKERVNGAWVVARQTYQLSASGDGIEAASADKQWPVFVEPLETEVGVFPPDDYPFRGKAEVIVAGSVRSHRPVRYLEPKIQVGAFSDRLLVFGNRRWVKRRDQLVPSDPEAFTAMDIGLANAFGGVDEYGGAPVPHPLNPTGKGFYLSPQAAEGKPLPNVERPETLIRSWHDKPFVATWSAVPNGQLWQMAAWNDSRSKNGEPPPQPKDDSETAALEAEAAKRGRAVFPSAASPRLLLDAITPGDTIALDLGDDKVRFTVPASAPTMRVCVGARTFAPTVKPTAVWIILPKELVVVTWMARYRYGLRPRERRSAFLMAQ
jgi:hypothetical protein